MTDDAEAHRNRTWGAIKAQKPPAGWTGYETDRGFQVLQRSSPDETWVRGDEKETWQLAKWIGDPNA